MLSTRQLLVTMLDRQMLLERVDRSVVDVLERMGGLQAQYAPSSYIGLWSRIAGFRRADHDEALVGRDAVVGTLMRSTIHLVATGDYWKLAAAIRPARKEWWVRSRRADVAAMDETVARLRALLRDGPMRSRDIERELGGKVMEGANQWTELLRVPPSGTWEKRRADLYALADAWIEGEEVDVDDATEHLVRRYLGGFGPATVADVASWAGVPKEQVQAAVERMGDELRPYGELVDLASASLADPDVPVPPRFLGVFDAMLLVHARRTEIVAEEHRPMLFDPKKGQPQHTFLVDGVLAGTWKHTTSGLELFPFGKLSKAAQAALDDEAHGLEALHQ